MDNENVGTAPSTTAEQLDEPTFKTVRKGLDPAEVQAYLSKTADRVRALEDRVQELDRQLDAAVRAREEAVARGASPGTFESVSGRVTELMTGLDADVERIRGEAAAEADRIVLDAKAEATLIEAQAGQKQAAAEQKLKQMQTEAEQSTAAFRSRQESVRGELRASCARVLKMISDLEATMGSDQPEQPVVLEEADDVILASVSEKTTLPEAPA